MNIITISVFKGGTGTCGGCYHWDTSGFGGACGGSEGLASFLPIFFSSYYLLFEASSPISSISCLKNNSTNFLM